MPKSFPDVKSAGSGVLITAALTAALVARLSLLGLAGIGLDLHGPAVLGLAVLTLALMLTLALLVASALVLAGTSALEASDAAVPGFSAASPVLVSFFGAGELLTATGTLANELLHVTRACKMHSRN